jgi:circadian clock protein KaiC
MTRAGRRSLTCLSTGEASLDTILGGGIPERAVVVVAGEPGSGKTVLMMQMVFDAARKGRKTLYLTTLSEPAQKLVQYMQLFDFFDPDVLHEHVVIADVGSSIRKGATVLLETLQSRIEAEEPAIIVIDSFRAMVEMLPDPHDRRTFTYDLCCHAAGWGATSFLVGEYTRDDVADRPEFAIADGIVLLGSEREELTSVRGLEVLKMRGMPYASGRHFLEVAEHGVAIYPRVSAPADATSSPSLTLADRVSTGVPGLDAALDGGLPRRSTTLIQGGTGTGKTLLGLRFLLEGASSGEPGILFTLEESSEQLRAIAASVGWNLAEAERAGRLTIVYTSPVELSTDRFLRTVSETVKASGARRAVFDSLTTMALGVPSERRYKELVYSLAKHLRSDDTTLVMTSETQQLLGSANLSGGGVSFIADNLLQLRSVEIDGRLDRSIAVIKARGIRHATEAHKMAIDEHGITITAGAFKQMRGVLTGLPYREAGDRRE